MRRIGGYVDGWLRRNIRNKWMYTGIVSGKEKLRDVVVGDGGEFNIICQNALSSSTISLKYEKTLSILLLYIYRK